MLVFVLNQAQKASTGKIQTPVYENVREFGVLFSSLGVSKTGLTGKTRGPSRPKQTAYGGGFRFQASDKSAKPDTDRFAVES